jgi:hypothetical protein
MSCGAPVSIDRWTRLSQSARSGRWLLAPTERRDIQSECDCSAASYFTLTSLWGIEDRWAMESRTSSRPARRAGSQAASTPAVAATAVAFHGPIHPVAWKRMHGDVIRLGDGPIVMMADGAPSHDE